MKYTLMTYGIHPERGTDGAAGFDFFIPQNYSSSILEPRQSIIIPTGVKLIIPEGRVGIFHNRGSIGSKNIKVGAHVVDSDYRGEIFINLNNDSNHGFILKGGMKIAQLVIMNYFNDIEEIDLKSYSEYSTIRNEGALGSTDK